MDVYKVISHHITDGTGQPRLGNFLWREPPHTYHVAVLAHISDTDHCNIGATGTVQGRAYSVVIDQIAAQLRIRHQGRRV
ncbi:hypothetical protein D3C78_1560340 [compost metagenome]